MDKDLDLIIRSLDDELQDQDRQRLEAVVRSEHGSRHLQILTRLRDWIRASRTDGFDDAFAGEVVAQLGHAKRPPATAGRVPRELLMGRMRVQTWHYAVVVFLLGVASAAWWQLSDRSSTAAYGATEQVSLPDGSVVQLSSGSELTYGRRFRSAREVSLTGEGFFNIAYADAQFVVHTEHGDVHVHGTRFNVRSWPSERSTTVTLETGSLSVSHSAATEAVRLEPGQTVVLTADADAPDPAPANIDAALAWTAGGIGFTNYPALYIFRDVERRYDVELTLRPADLRERRLTYLSPNPKLLNELLDDLCHALGLHYRKTSDGYEIYEP